MGRLVVVRDIEWIAMLAGELEIIVNHAED